MTITSYTTVTSLATAATTAFVETTSTAVAESTTTTEESACVETQVVVNPGFDDSASRKSPWSGAGNAVAQADLSLVLACSGEYDQLTIKVDDITFTKLCGPQAS
ncbi:hypothetical protein FVER53590_05684 [Fusarium verticillioides]|nr:hypothetical protein FVER53263_05684 [Fusarium verticillioides]RBR16931.1 hypothetical protein FVER53590_05684 [Fusarium verticillioides]